jgi:hypothetical protein
LFMNVVERVSSDDENVDVSAALFGVVTAL